MMKLKVVDDYTNVVEVEADTIDTLKARIMECFSSSKEEEDLRSKRLLVRDGRAIPANRHFCPPMVDGFDLLALEEGSILKDHGLKGGDTLLLGWKGPFIIRFVPASFHIIAGLEESFEIEIENPYVTLGELKRAIMRGTGEPVTAENLPTILFEGDDEKPLIFFGFYRYYKGFPGREMVEFRICPNRDNEPQFTNLLNQPRASFYRTEPRKLRYYGQRYDSDEETDKLMVGRLDEDGKMVLVPLRELQKRKKKKKKNEWWGHRFRMAALPSSSPQEKTGHVGFEPA